LIPNKQSLLFSTLGWAFAALGALEGQIYKKDRKLVKLSAQQLVDCSSNILFGNLGCVAGIVGYAYRYIAVNGVTTAEEYPYDGTDDNDCQYNKTEMLNATVVSYSWVQIPNQSFLTNVLAFVGPLAVGVDASLFTFQNYRTGVFANPKCSNTLLNHALLLVGFGHDKRWGDYWLLKNSYGEVS